MAKNTKSFLDVPNASLIHQNVIKTKHFLRELYIDFYEEFQKRLPLFHPAKTIVEIGSGGGFLKEIIPAAITSDIILLPSNDLCFSAINLPFKSSSIGTFIMLDAMHHIPNANALFSELNRCLCKSGKIIMIEPYNSFFSRLVYSFHHELFDPKGGWNFESTGPLSSANGALPWILFCRDIHLFKQLFPSLRVVSIFPHTAFRYIASGGLTYPQFLPNIASSLLQFIEILSAPFYKQLGLFMTIELEKE